MATALGAQCIRGHSDATAMAMVEKQPDMLDPGMRVRVACQSVVAGGHGQQRGAMHVGVCAQARRAASVAMPRAGQGDRAQALASFKIMASTLFKAT